MALAYAKITDTCEVEAGEAITAADLVAIRSDGLVYRANAGVGADQEGPAVGLAEASAAVGEIVEIKREGKMSGSTIVMTPGAWVYLGTTDGEATPTAPSASGDIIQVVGQAVARTEWMIQVESHSVVP